MFNKLIIIITILNGLELSKNVFIGSSSLVKPPMNPKGSPVASLESITKPFASINFVKKARRNYLIFDGLLAGSIEASFNLVVISEKVLSNLPPA